MKRRRNQSSPGTPFSPQADSQRGPKAGEDRPEPRAPGGGGKSPRRERPLAPGLYVTATPIGNAADITLRALDILRSCDAIVAEDTRVTAKLLAIHGISRPLLAYNDHNTARARPKLLEKLRHGATLALVSDAGTPLISDPGHKLVYAARAEGIPVFPVPGASATLAALSAAGLPTDRFFFAGFLSSRSGERRSTLNELRDIPATLVFFESPQRLAESLADMSEILGPREAAVARELTKLHEEIRRAPLARLAAEYAKTPPKGEITLLIAPPQRATLAGGAAIDALLARALPFMPVKAAAALVAAATGHPRRAVYARALALKSASDGKET